MKLVFGLALMLAWAASFAQQAPRAMERDQVPREAQVPGGWRERPDKQVPALPVPPPPQAPQGASTAQAELMQAQTAAIKALAAKVDELSARVSKLEKGAR